MSHQVCGTDPAVHHRAPPGTTGFCNAWAVDHQAGEVVRQRRAPAHLCGMTAPAPAPAVTPLAVVVPFPTRPGTDLESICRDVITARRSTADLPEVLAHVEDILRGQDPDVVEDIGVVEQAVEEALLATG